VSADSAPKKTTLGKWTMRAVAMPRSAASASYAVPIGSGDRMRRSAASTSAARCSTAWPMRSVKKPTPVSPVTATSSATASTASSPERQSRESASSANRRARIRSP
jgi:hypothetical protein